MTSIRIRLLTASLALGTQLPLHAEEARFWPTAEKHPAPKATATDIPALPGIQSLRVQPLFPALPETATGTLQVAPAKPASVAKLVPVISPGTEIPVYQAAEIRPFSAIYLIDQTGNIFSTAPGGGLDWQQFSFTLRSGKGSFSGAQFNSQPMSSLHANEQGIRVAIELPQLQATTEAVLTPDFSYPGAATLNFSAPKASNGHAGQAGASGNRGIAGSDGERSGYDGDDGRNGSDGTQGQPGANGLPGQDLGTVVVNIDQVDSQFSANGLWRLRWQYRSDSRPRQALLPPNSELMIIARGGDGGDGGNGGSGGAGGSGGKGGDGAKGRTGSHGKDGRNGYRGSPGRNATASSNGTNGSRGGPGSDGTDGGRGGSGGDGGKGGSGGKGGKGGRGGNAGDGGDGARLLIQVSGSPQLLAQVKRAVKVDIAGGQAGQPGSGGPGGKAGSAGRGGSAGAGGRGGAGGDGGAGGPGGRGGAAYNGYRYYNGVAVPYTNFGGIDGWPGASGSDGRRGSSGSDGDRGRSGKSGIGGQPGATGNSARAGSSGSLLFTSASSIAKEQRYTQQLDKKLQQARSNEDSSKAARLAEEKARHLSPETSATGSWQKVDAALQEGVEALSEGDDLDSLERLLNQQIEASQQ
ncbi:collagen-like triple helix repeat-containing protein [Marinobacterium jannaschii]|uniref:collagen-like triple helix repeat-containing protein n=1 Tax=Marinobacterium jannaschii TaxID=64970 RepID=UPI000485B75D|nr:collagen-like protein [Marinobacterium jannaschii]